MRHMKQARRVDNGELVQGYYFADTASCTLRANGKCACSHDGTNAWMLVWQDEFHEYSEIKVDPSTVEDVAMKPIFDGKLFACPNCGAIELHNSRNIYCPDCGQRIDWSGEDGE